MLANLVAKDSMRACTLQSCRRADAGNTGDMHRRLTIPLVTTRHAADTAARWVLANLVAQDSMQARILQSCRRADAGNTGDMHRRLTVPLTKG